VKFALFLRLGDGRGEWLCEEWCYCSVNLIEVRGDVSVGVCMLGLSMVSLVLVEIWGEVPPVGEIWWRCRWGEWYGMAVSSSMAMYVL